MLVSFVPEMYGNEEHHPGKTEGNAQFVGEGKTAHPPHPGHQSVETHKL